MSSSPIESPDLSDAVGGAVSSSSSSSSYHPSDDDSSPPVLSATTHNTEEGEQRGTEQPVPSSGQNLAPRVRKPYTSDVRPKPQERTKPPRKSDWSEELATMTKPKFRLHTCCVQLKCYRHVDYDFYLKKARELIKADQDTRRTILRSFLGSNKKFKFDGQVVCVLFLRKAFHFSSVLIAEIANGKAKKHTLSSSGASSRHVSASSDNSHATSDQSNTSISSIDLQVKKKDAVISFVQRIAEDCGDAMPHRTEVHLPFYNYNELYPVFEAEFKKLYPSFNQVSPVYFRRTWQLCCPHIKVMKVSRFTTCDICDELRTALRQKIVDGESTTDIRHKRKAHLEFVARERLEYQKKRDRARLNPGEYCSIIIDGADQSAFGIPHFTSTPKSQRGHAMKVKLVGLLEHRLTNKLSLLTMTQEHATGANHVVEVLHRFLNQKRADGPLPPKFFVQLDNCSRENKNQYVMAYLELLVANKVFQSVEAGFLPVGHTHEDVDQAFSQTSARLRVRNAITLDDLHNELRGAYGGNVHVEHMRRVANWSGLCDEERCLRKVDRITHWRYFLFSPHVDATGSDHAFRKTICHVKKNCSDPWVRLFPATSSSKSDGILRSQPSLVNMPDLVISCPDGVEKVAKRFESEEGRVNDVQKMIQLHELRDFVFKARTDKCHWDLDNTIETELLKSVPETPSATETHTDNTIEGTASNLPSSPLQPLTTGAVHLNPSSTVLTTNSQSAPDASVPEIVPEDGSLNRDVGTKSRQISTSSTQRSARTEPCNKFDYAVGSFVVVQAEKGTGSSSTKYWVGKVVEVYRAGNSNYATQLKVHWHDDPSHNQEDVDIFTFTFDPCYQSQTQKRRKMGTKQRPSRQQLKTPWYDTIHTDTVVVAFESLTKRRTLPLCVQKKLS